MTSREQMAWWILAIFASQLIVNVLTLALVVYKVMAMNQFYRWSKDYLQLTKQYAELVTLERGQVARIVQSNAAQTQEKIELKTEEIKQEISKVAATTETQREARENGR